MNGFFNQPLLELRRGSVRSAAEAALADLDRRLPLQVPLLAGEGERRGGGLVSPDPCRPEREVAIAAAGSEADAAAAVGQAVEGHREWSRRPAALRCAVLSRAAGLLRERRLELAALAVRECAKPWPEADADACEAIDFLEYYAQGALRLEQPPELLQPAGERNSMRYVARGVTAVIAPWNFPFAIATGMTAAALATGNAVVLKPAEQAPGCAHAVVVALREAGVPPAALSLVPGGDGPGRALVADPRVHTIVFTGSCQAGLSIIERAAKAEPGQTHVKRVIAEMGGKNCVIVDADADLDDVVPALLASAFGFAGQKCSAASRLLAHEAIAEQLGERLVGALESLRVGPAEDFATDVPALIDREAQQRVEGHVSVAAGQAELLARGERREDGFYAAPTIAIGLPADAPALAEEIFGPVLAIETVRDVEEACDRIDAIPFALTGGLFSRSPAMIEYVSGRTPVGNLYVNREITGAMVGRQPFGGSRLSGTGPKAGGPDYLMQFVEARAISENTVRHGLVV